MRSCKTLQGYLVAFVVAKVAGVLGYLFDNRGDKYFSGLRQRADARSDDYRLAKEVATFLTNRFTGVNADADPERNFVVLVAINREPALDSYRAL